MKNRFLKGLIASFALAVSGFANAGLIGIGTPNWYTDTLENNLVSEGHTVTTYNSYDASILTGLDVYIQDGNNFFNAALLDEFVFNGGTLIQIPWAFTHNSYTTDTKIMGSRTSLTFGAANPDIDVLDVTSWLLDGVSLPAAGEFTVGREIGNLFELDTNAVLNWADGTALLGYKEYGEGISIGFNVHLITSDSNPLNADWSNQIIYNAVNGASVVQVPEPSTLAIFTLGLMGLAFRKFNKQA